MTNRITTPHESLLAVAALATIAPESNGKVHPHGSAYGHSPLDVAAWLDHRGVAWSDGGADGAGRRKYILVECPFDPSHTGKDAAIFQGADGKLGFKCFHDSCGDRSWQDAKQQIGPPLPQHYLRAMPAVRCVKPSKAVASGTIVRAGDLDNFGEVIEDHGGTCSVHFISPTGSEMTKELPKSLLYDAANGQCLDGENAEPVKLEMMDSRTFASTNFKQQFQVKRMLVAGQPCIIGGAKKTLKTSTAIDLVLSIGSGAPFIGEFDVVERQSVGIVSGESGGFTLQETANRICRTKGINLADVDVFWGTKLPHIADPAHLLGVREFIEQHDIKALVVDPAYLSLMTGVAAQGRSASNVFDMGCLLTGYGQVGVATGCTMLLIHHLRKGVEQSYEPPDLEDLAFAGFAEWARQWLLIGRRSRYEPGTGLHNLWLTVGGSAGHSGCWAVDINEGVPDEFFCGRTWNVSIGAPGEARQRADEKRERRKELEQDERIASALAEFPDGETQRKIAEIAGVNVGATGRALRRLEKAGLTTACTITKSGKNYDGFKLADASATGQDECDLFGKLT